MMIANKEFFQLGGVVATVVVGMGVIYLLHTNRQSGVVIIFIQNNDTHNPVSVYELFVCNARGAVFIR